jgi:drug/metabolite transporter (DMT)-like permease
MTNEESNGDSGADISPSTGPALKSQKDFNVLKFMVPAACYLVSCVLQLISLSKITSSTFMLLRSSLMVFTGILSLIFTKKKLYVHHAIAMAIVAIGLSVVAVLAEVYKEKDLIENNEFEAAEADQPS